MVRQITVGACAVGLMLFSFVGAASRSQSEPLSQADLELKACGPKDREAKYSADTDKTQHPTPDPPGDLALIYVLRPTMMGQRIQTALAVDGDWKGVNRGDTYFFFTLRPGDHHVCSKAENRSILAISVEAGKTYFLQQHIEMGFLKARTRVERMEEAEARAKLVDLHLATWQIKS